jgi:hypothetical protein
MSTQGKSLLGIAIGAAIFLGVLYFGAKAISAGWSSGK